MSRRDLAIVIVVALGVNSVVALLTTTPGDSVDAHYALAGGTLIASGEGFTAPYFWNYVNPPTDLPAPSYRYWQPLSALLSAIGIVVLGDLLPPFGAAQAVYVLAGSLVPVLAALTAARLGEPRHGLIAGLLAAFSGIYAVYWSIPETFTPFALGAGLALLCTIVAREDGPSWIWLVAGLGAGIGHLARADGLLLLGVVGLFALLPHREEPVRRRVLFGALVTGGYLLVMGPWFARNIMVFGSWQAPGGLSTLWIAEYNQIFDFPAVITPSTLFEQGVGPPLLARVEAL
ncbi:MAG: glycosyltransferase family 39 protein, partial [Chloroflexi bacterium]|nr:glycosyltransferase family 39 protein [Chloroflexota bacterium]